MPTTYTDAQFFALRRLAAAHGHGWATEPDMPDAHPVPGCQWTRELVTDLYHAIARRDQWGPMLYGIDAPPDQAVHTTGTGRVTWSVDEGGRVGIVVSRPYVDHDSEGTERDRGPRVVLSALLYAGDGQLPWDMSRRLEIRTPETSDRRIPDVHTAMWSPEDGPRAEARHADALLWALRALVGEDAARAALAEAGVSLLPLSDAPQSMEVPGQRNEI